LLVSAVVQVVADHAASHAEQEDHKVEANTSAETLPVLEVVGGYLDFVDNS
jgi:hypothetical protein